MAWERVLLDEPGLTASGDCSNYQYYCVKYGLGCCLPLLLLEKQQLTRIADTKEMRSTAEVCQIVSTDSRCLLSDGGFPLPILSQVGYQGKDLSHFQSVNRGVPVRSRSVSMPKQ